MYPKKDKVGFYINALSPHLFWDIDREKMDMRRNKKWIIQRVLEYGLINDWRIIQSFYKMSEIARIAVQIKDLDAKSMAFISLLSKIPKTEFLCYTTKQSSLKHWNF